MNRTNKITIVSNWSGDYYPLEYVNRLYRAVCRNTTIPFDFVLHIGPEAEKPGKLEGLDSRIIPVPVGLPSWWSSMAAFQHDPPGIYTGSLLFLDLDIVIVGSLDDLINYPSNLALMKDYPAKLCPKGNENDGNTGITLIRNGAGAKVWDEYVKAGMPTWDAIKVHGGGDILPLATMTIINDPCHEIKKHLFPEEWVSSYKLQVLRDGLPEDCRIVHFHGQPKQEACNDQFIKDNWI